MSEAQVPAGFVRRIAVMVYDGLLVTALLFVISAVATLIYGQSIPANNAIFSLLLLLVGYAFYAWCWLRGGQTLGMQTWKIKIVSENGAPLTLYQTLIRALSALITYSIGLGLLWMLIDPQKRTLADRLSRTYLVFFRSQ